MKDSTHITVHVPKLVVVALNNQKSKIDYPVLRSPESNTVASQDGATVSLMGNNNAITASSDLRFELIKESFRAEEHWEDYAQCITKELVEKCKTLDSVHVADDVYILNREGQKSFISDDLDNSDYDYIYEVISEYKSSLGLTPSDDVNKEVDALFNDSNYLQTLVNYLFRTKDIGDYIPYDEYLVIGDLIVCDYSW